MDAAFILHLYLVLFAAWMACELWLDALNLRHVRAHAGAVPPLFARHVDEQTWRRSQQYTLAKGRFGMISTAYSGALTLVWVLGAWFGALDDAWRSLLEGRPYLHGVAFIFSVSMLFFVLELPFSLYRTFVIEERFGFNRLTAKLWLFDLAKSTVLSVAIGAPVLFLLLWFMNTTGEHWWIYAFAAVSAVQLSLLYLYPVLISPLFNKFTPLAEGELHSAIMALAERTGFSATGIFVMDGSRRSAHANAYFTGFGSNKRIVLFDTLIQSLQVPQTAAVLAHEIGHEKRHHVKKGIAVSLLIALAGFYLLGLMLQHPAFYAAFGFSRPSDHAALIIFMFASGPLMFFLSPLLSRLSRTHEYEADRFASEAVGDWKPLGEALLTLHKTSLANFTPHPLYSFFHYSHPTLAERLDAMQKGAAS